jgi:hypothetical protein
MYYPAITTAALFTAIIIDDAIKKNSDSIPTHAFMGLLCVGAMIFLSMKGADFVAWGILVLPMFIIILSFVLVYMDSPIVTANATHTVPVAANISSEVCKPAPAASSAKVVTGQTVQLPNISNSSTFAAVTTASPRASASVTPSTPSCGAPV